MFAAMIEAIAYSTGAAPQVPCAPQGSGPSVKGGSGPLTAKQVPFTHFQIPCYELINPIEIFV